MFGFDGKETENLRARFRKIPQEDKAWKTAEDFMMWAAESGYITGTHLRKHNDALPHGPNNSYWLNRDSEKARKRYTDEVKKGCEFCKDCSKDICDNGIGCKEWQRYFTKNWNKNIHVPPVKPVVQEGPMVFRYEHPDLVREGIVFNAEC